MIVYGTLTDPTTIAVFYRFGESVERAFKVGETLRITLDHDRNSARNAAFHLMLSKIADIINDGPAQTSIDDLKRWIKIQFGWYEVQEMKEPLPDGTKYAVVYKSTSFATMGEDEFHIFVKNTCGLIRDQLAPWIATDSARWIDVMNLVDKLSPLDIDAHIG